MQYRGVLTLFLVEGGLSTEPKQLVLYQYNHIEEYTRSCMYKLVIHRQGKTWGNTMLATPLLDRKYCTGKVMVSYYSTYR